VIRVGCAGWELRREAWELFPREGTHLQRYAGRFNAVEINSSFYRPHRPQTYARWAASVPAGFRFSVKVPRTITHRARLVDAGALLDEFLDPVQHLGDRLGCLLIQLPPSLELDAGAAAAFLDQLRSRYAGAASLEPRHATWFSDAADDLLCAHRVSRVAADPPRHARDGSPLGTPAYFRLHGSPRIYYSAYPPETLDAVASELSRSEAAGGEPWCIFDNTALGAATLDAISLMDRLSR
jgi:uncharacterized protein YecE (DUF72 family)